MRRFLCCLLVLAALGACAARAQEGGAVAACPACQVQAHRESLAARSLSGDAQRVAYREAMDQWRGAIEAAIADGRLRRGMEAVEVLGLLGQPTDTHRHAEGEWWRWSWEVAWHVQPAFDVSFHDGRVNHFTFTDI